MRDGTTMMLAQLRDLFHHLEWADAAFWKAVRACVAAETDGDLLGRLYHLHVVQHAYVQIWEGRRPELTRADELPTVASLQDWARAGHAALGAALAGCDPSRLSEAVNLPWAGPPRSAATLAETMLQVVMHSTHHRGQNALRLRALGGESPLTDYVAWIWNGRPAAAWP
jgi:uncharacterized damage-inducible protein DinB